MSNASFHSIDDIPAPSLLGTDGSDEVNSAGNQATLGKDTTDSKIPVLTSPEKVAGTMSPSDGADTSAMHSDVQSNDVEVSQDSDTGAVCSGDINGSCLDALSDTLATASDVLKQVTCLPPIKAALEGSSAAVDHHVAGHQSAAASECSSPEAPDNFELSSWPGEAVSG